MSRSATHDRLLALTPRRALAIFRTLPANPCTPWERHPREKVHIPPFPAPRGAARAGKRSFPAYHCTRKISCKDMGELHDDLQRYGGNGRKTACRTCRKTYISPTSLHEVSQMQGYGGNVRKRAGPAPLTRPACLRWGKENRVFTPVRQPPWRSAPRRPTSSWWGNANVSSESQDVPLTHFATK